MEGVEGSVVLSYQINDDCSVSDVKINKSLNQECDNTVLKAFEKTIGFYFQKYSHNCKLERKEIKYNFNLEGVNYKDF